MRTRWLAVFLTASTVLAGADRDFERIVKAVESHYGSKPVHIPFMGMASFFVKVGHAGGASGFQLAVFRDLDSPGGDGPIGMDRFMSGLSSRNLNPLLRVHSREKDQSTYIFTGEVGKSTKMLIATFHRHEATVIEVKVDMATLMKTVATPESAGQSFEIKGTSEDR